MPDHREILDYHRDVATRTGLREHIRFDTEVVAATWSGERRGRSRPPTGGSERFRVLVCATGFLHHPRIPDFEGLEDFAGDARPLRPLARRDRDGRAAGRRGRQRLDRRAARQRARRRRVARDDVPAHAAVDLPAAGLRHPARSCGGCSRASRRERPARRRRCCGSPTGSWAARRSATTGGGGSSTRVARAQPAHGPRPRAARQAHPARRRAVQAAGRLDALLQGRPARRRRRRRPPRSQRVVPEGVVTADGVTHPLDVLILATGFEAHNYMRPIAIRGEDGVTLDEAWANGPHGYRTVSLPGFPNLFMLLGPAQPAEHDLHPRERRAAVRLRHADARGSCGANGTVSLAPTRRGDGALAGVHPRRHAGNRLGERMQQLVPRRRRHAGAVAVRPARLARGAAAPGARRTTRPPSVLIRNFGPSWRMPNRD